MNKNPATVEKAEYDRPGTRGHVALVKTRQIAPKRSGWSSTFGDTSLG
ncbi:MAG: hypothetical protein ABI537_00325 [Casimicrobiaceae bacterium]